MAIKGMIVDENEYALSKVSDMGNMTEQELSEAFKALSLSDETKAKQALANYRKRLSYAIDTQKMQENIQLSSGISTAISELSNPETISKIAANMDTARDLYDFAKATEVIVKMRENLKRLDSLDGQGTAKELSLKFVWGENSNSTTVVVKTGEDD